MGMTDDPNFSKLPTHDLDLHRWWAAQAQGDPHSLGDFDMALDCIAQADASIKDQLEVVNARQVLVKKPPKYVLRTA